MRQYIPDSRFWYRLHKRVQLPSTTADSYAGSAVSMEAVKPTKFCKRVKAKKGKAKHFRCFGFGWYFARIGGRYGDGWLRSSTWNNGYQCIMVIYTSNVPRNQTRSLAEPCSVESTPFDAVHSSDVHWDDMQLVDMWWSHSGNSKLFAFEEPANWGEGSMPICKVTCFP